MPFPFPLAKHVNYIWSDSQQTCQFSFHPFLIYTYFRSSKSFSCLLVIYTLETEWRWDFPLQYIFTLKQLYLWYNMRCNDIYGAFFEIFCFHSQNFLPHSQIIQNGWLWVNLKSHACLNYFLCYLSNHKKLSIF